MQFLFVTTQEFLVRGKLDNIFNIQRVKATRSIGFIDYQENYPSEFD